ncbi:MAG: aminotransferase class V-fold PLP-dependent enzyme [Candidatus Latescibacteria bacterium]|nr:aminotransferase class V-fold PLP-dependent enzyme [Candidatus Latescibacterota bacterium]NIO27312.1 aminotransferase class V-fold PLP-dependent enzyme [Candidatus Latescibacterota bacterium]NIO54836.1 aminotransferase class V-fold PLP-dependent enzyme [Candidatus Latescibacterota bacterium]NIT00919.1 aminotransferase class V-fold PLP-dependent enzyme [Candidatus Latescibacterota bacterium]NIT37842.1 aminotransferase class V-fold PLP-dependent enzyme [Candidatus Latescibacterota bacterium]
MVKTIFVKSEKGRKGYRFSNKPIAIPESIPEEYRRKGGVGLPEVSEPQVVRHFVALSTLNHHVDRDLYPLGSCTMKYNPKVNEDVAAMKGFSGLHPEQSCEDLQGALEVIHVLENKLSAITGMEAVSLQSAAGAQGELLGMFVARKHFDDRKESRTKVLVPDTAHGTNPASVYTAGFESRTIRSGDDGEVDIDALAEALDEKTAVLMLTVPNTLGIFESRIDRIIEITHKAGALCYLDGANLNAILGHARPGDMGFDMMHLNLHKTFSTPHGGGGPGSGPLCVKAALERYLPNPRVTFEDGNYRFSYDNTDAVGAIHSFYGNFAVYLRALVYIERLGAEGLRRVSAVANLNANYLAKALADTFPIPYGERCMHEFVASGESYKKHGIRTLDIAKRLLDFGFHAPTIYFPLVVSEALMIEPTETESKETLDRFIAVMKQIAREAVEQPELLREAPHECPVGRLDEITANRRPVLAEPYE